MIRDGICKGLCLTALTCTLGYFLAQQVPLGWVSSSIIAGFLIANIVGLGKKYKAGIDYSEKHILSLAIILLGSQLDFTVLSGLGFETLALIILIVSFTVTLGYLIGPLFGIRKNLSLLLGVGTGVCGASAIAAASKTLNSPKEDTGLSIALVNSLGSAGIAIIPAMALAIGLGNTQAGVYIGGSLQAVGQVTAAGFAINDEVGAIATVVKMARVLLLGPLIILLGLIFASGKKGKGVGVPPFIAGFILLMVLANLNLFNEPTESALSHLTKSSLAFAMAAVGLNISLRDVMGKGSKALACASALFAIQVVMCLALTLILLS
jgi:uncharacterized integral membrane protein (TIGR00698 family)